MDNEDTKDIRWKQRFNNFEKAIHHLRETISISVPTEVERAGVIQFFEVAFELGWKTLKDYLHEQGYEGVTTPRESIKQAFQIKLIENGFAWIEMLEKRNLLTHTYDEAIAQEAWVLITNNYINHLLQAYDTLKKRL